MKLLFASGRIFTCDGDVHVSFFNFENVGMRGNSECDKSFNLLADLHGTKLRTSDTTFDASRLKEFLKRVDNLYSRAGFNHDAKLGFLKITDMKI